MRMALLQIMLAVLQKWHILVHHVRAITDKLDALGNTTAAMGKGFAIGSALLTALAMFAAYAEKQALTALNFLIQLVLGGMFIGGVMPFVISCINDAFSWRCSIENGYGSTSTI